MSERRVLVLDEDQHLRKRSRLRPEGVGPDGDPAPSGRDAVTVREIDLPDARR